MQVVMQPIGQRESDIRGYNYRMPIPRTRQHRIPSKFLKFIRYMVWFDGIHTWWNIGIFFFTMHRSKMVNSKISGQKYFTKATELNAKVDWKCSTYNFKSVYFLLMSAKDRKLLICKLRYHSCICENCG